MKAVLQRVSEASVTIKGRKTAAIGKGFLILAGLARNDNEETVSTIAAKICRLRVFEDDTGRMNLDIKQAGGKILSVSQFTLLGDTRKGNRPGFENSMPPAEAEKLWYFFNACIEHEGISVEKGDFGERMRVGLINDGPVTFVIEN